MDFQISAQAVDAASTAAADALLVVVPAGEAKTGDAALDALIARVVKQGDFERKAGSGLYLQGAEGVKATRVVLVGAASLAAKAVRKALDAGLAALKGRNVKHLAVTLAGGVPTAAHAEALVCAMEQASYTYTQTKPSAKVVATPAKVTLLTDKAGLAAARAAIKQGLGVAEGVRLARTLGNMPANFCTPTFLGAEAKRMAKEGGMKAQVLGLKEIEKLGMGSFLSVTRGSVQPPAFIVLEYQGAGAKAAPIVLVGKGITFDTGGISLKPGADMDEMKFDMCGAAAVLGTMRAVAELKPKVNVVALVPACENMPSGVATKPGDVVTSMSGQTIEVLNTDAEGRLVLCDALTYAERFKPQAVVDVATLTGAIIIGLGNHNLGLYASDDTLADDLLTASKEALDPAWRMPLDEEYDEALKSNFADMANVGSRAGGSITAAKFLQRYTGSYAWAHLDIAGVSHKSGAQKGATGRPVGLLTHFVLNRAK